MERPLTLDRDGLQQAVVALCAADPRLARLQRRNGDPPRWERPEGFATLLRIILEQQVSLDSAAAAYRNLAAELGVVEPAGFLRLDAAVLRRVGFSSQKADYGRSLATGLLEGSIDLAGMRDLDDGDARRRLMQIRGVGPWTADVYLLFALQRADVWPRGDRALVVSMAESLELDEIPSSEDAAAVADSWRPWRSVAARMLWHSYLLRRGRAVG
jgi:DNA-3-methyladenine glycosylase II